MLKKITRHRTYFVTQFMAALGAWAIVVTIIVATPFFQTWLQGYPLQFYATVLILTFGWAYYRLRDATDGVDFRVQGTELSVSIGFGNIFAQEGSIIVPVSHRFRHRLETNGGTVKSASVHGQLIPILGGEEEFRRLVDAALRDISSSGSGTTLDETAVFPIGTVASLKRPDQEGYFHLLATTEEAIGTGETKSTLPVLVYSLSMALEHISLNDQSRSLAIPLIGANFGRVQLAKQNLLDALVATVSEFHRRKIRSGRVVFVLGNELRGRLKLYNIRKEWGG